MENDKGYGVWLNECNVLLNRIGLSLDLDEYYTMGLSPQQAVEQSLVLFFTELRSRLTVA